MTVKELIERYKIRSLYHFTDEANLPSIREHKGLYSVEQLECRGIAVPKPGGNQWSRDADAYKGFQRHVHLSFMDDHPMKFHAEQDGRIGPVRILQIDPQVMNLPNVVYTKDVSNKRGVPALKFDEAVEQLDFEVMYTRTDWKDPEIQERLRIAKKAEILVPNFVPIGFIRGL